jgi:hypothetical protein
VEVGQHGEAEHRQTGLGNPRRRGLPARRRHRNGHGDLALQPASRRGTASRNLYIEVYTASDSTGDLFIGSDGSLEAYNGEATTFTSLATVSFPTAAVAAHRLTLHGWQSSQSEYQTGNPSYAVSHGVVYLSGSLHGGKSKLAFVLPKAARPAPLPLPVRRPLPRRSPPGLAHGDP